MRRLLPAAIGAFALGLVLGLALGRTAPPAAERRPAGLSLDPDARIRLARVPGGEPDAPAPAGGTFVPVRVTLRGEQPQRLQPRAAPPAGPLWALWLGEDLVVHCVRVPD